MDRGLGDGNPSVEDPVVLSYVQEVLPALEAVVFALDGLLWLRYMVWCFRVAGTPAAVSLKVV